MKKPEGPEPARVIAPLRDEAVGQLMVHFLRNPLVLSSALAVVRPEHFTREPEFQILWNSIVAKTAEHGLGAVPYTALYLDVLDRLDLAPGELTSAQGDRLIGTPEMVDQGQAARMGVLYHAYHRATEDELNTELGTDLLRRFLQERAVSEEIRRKFALSGTMVPGDIYDFTCEVMSRLSTIRAIGKSVELDPSDENLLPRRKQIQSTGIPFLDGVLDGGHAADETYLLFGPEKGGKTQLALMLMASVGWVANRAVEQGEEPRWAFYFTFEEPHTDLLSRLYCYGARIRRDRLEYKLDVADDYSRTGHLQPYEIEMYREMGEDMYRISELPGEWERLVAWKRSAGRFTRFFDHTRRHNPAVGGGGIPEVVAELNRQRLLGRQPGVVILDYINTCVGNEIAARGLREDALRSRAKQLVYDAGAYIASPFQCPVWLLQQYGAEANKRNAATRLSAADGAEVRTLGAACNFSFCIGVRDLETNVAQFTVDRARRTKSQGKVLQLAFEGDFGRWGDVTGKFDINAATGSITSKVRSALTAGLDETTRRTLQSPQGLVDPFTLERDLASDN